LEDLFGATADSGADNSFDGATDIGGAGRSFDGAAG
jgi:hypothetical protein